MPSEFLKQSKRVAYVVRDVIEVLINAVSHISSAATVAVSEAIEAGVLVGHCTAQQCLQIVVVLGGCFLGGEIGYSLIELGNGVFEELDAVIESSFLTEVELAELPFDSGAAVGGDFNLLHSVIYCGGDDLCEGFGRQIWERSEGRNAELWV